jgi:hypothetical protein
VTEIYRRNSRTTFLFILVLVLELWYVRILVGSNRAELALLVTGVVVVWLTLFQKLDLPLLVTVFLSLAIVDYWLASTNLGQFLGSVVLFFALFFTGATSQKIISSKWPVLSARFKDNPIKPEINTDLATFSIPIISQLWQLTLADWLLLALLMSEANSLIEFLPITFFDQALIGLVVFYVFWQLFYLADISGRRSVISHLVFSFLAVILVIVGILWKNSANLRIF